MSRQKRKNRGILSYYIKGMVLIGAAAMLLCSKPVYAAEIEDIPAEIFAEEEMAESQSDVNATAPEVISEEPAEEEPVLEDIKTEEIPSEEVQTEDSEETEMVESQSDVNATAPEVISEESAEEVESSVEETENAEENVADATTNEVVEVEVSEPLEAQNTTESDSTQIEVSDEPEEDASMELPDGTAYVENIGVDMFGDTVMTYTNTATGNGAHTGNAIQNAVDAAMGYALGKNWEEDEAKEVTVVVENGEYVGDLMLVNTMGADSFVDSLLTQYGLPHTFFDQFIFIIRSHDALDENGQLSASSAGGARLNGNILIDNMNVVIAGLTMGLDYTTTVRNTGQFTYYGTTENDVVDIYVDSHGGKVDENSKTIVGTVDIDLGEGNDDLVLVVDQKPAFSVDVTDNVVTQLKLPQNILDMIANMAEDELQNILTNGISPSTSPTLDSLMDGLSDTAKAALEGEILNLIKDELEALGENISDTAAEVDVTVNGGAGHDRLQVSVNSNSNLNLMPSFASGDYGIASLALQMDMSRTNVTMYGEDGNDQMLVDGSWKGFYQTMLLHKALEELTDETLAKLNDETAEVKLYGGADDDTLQINTDYAFTTVWNAKAYMDGGNGVDRTNLAGTVNDGILAELIPQDIEQIKKTVNGNVTTWTLDAIKAWTLVENNITHIEEPIFWIRKDLEIENINVETFTDALANKFAEEIEWTANGYQGEKIAVEEFKDYVIEITEDIIFKTGQAVTAFSFDVRDFFINPTATGFLTQLIINLMDTRTLTISEIYAPGWTVLISGFDMILGDIVAKDLFVSAMVPDMTIDGTIPTQDTNIEMHVKDSSNIETQNNLDGTVDVSMKSYLYRYEGKASITMNGKTEVDGLAVITSSLTMDKGFVNLPDIASLLAGGINPNIAVYKEGLSEVKVLNDIIAAAIQISAITNVDIDAAFAIPLPISGGVARTNTYLIVGGGTQDDRTTLNATVGNVWLNALTNIRIGAYAKAFGGVPFAGAVAYVDSDTAATIKEYAEIISKGDVDIEANSIINLDTDSTGATPYSVAVDVNSGIFPALQVAIVTTKAEVTGNADVTSENGNINVNSNSRLESRVESLSVPGQGQDSAFKMTSGLKVLEYYMGIPQGSFVKSRVPFLNILTAVTNYFNTGTMGATDDNKYVPSDNQFIGAFSVAYIDHSNQAIINTAGNVTALNGDVNVIANADSVVSSRADGSLYKTAAVADIISFYHQPNNAVGVGVGVNIIKHHNSASYKKGSVKANGLSVKANSYTPVALVVKAGHIPTESKIGIGGAIAVNVYSSTTEATVEEEAEPELGNSSLTVIAYQDGDIKIIGDASGKRSTLLSNLMIGGTSSTGTLPRKGSIGFGTGIAVNVTGIDVTAKVSAPISQRAGTKLSEINIQSIFDGTEYIEARAGASAGVSIVPVVLVNISGVSTLTEVETGTTLISSGDADIHSEVRMIRTLIADADTVANKVGFGGTFLINVTEDTAESYLYTSITSDRDVNVTAEAISRLSGKSYASSKGAQASLTGEQLKAGYGTTQQKGQADQFADKNLINGSTLAGNVNSRNTNSTKVSNKMKNRQMAATAEGQVQVAAGFGLNIQESKSIAAIGRFEEEEETGDEESEEDEEDAKLAASDDLPEIIIKAKNVNITTGNDTDGILHVSAAAVNSEVAVGVAVGINMVDYTNQVILGKASVDTEELTLQSEAIEIAQLKETEQLVEELVTFLTDVIGVEKFLQSIVHYEQNEKKLPIDESELDSNYKELDALLTYFDEKESSDEYEGEEPKSYSDLTAEEKALVKAQLNDALTTAILGGQTSDVAETAVNAVVESLATKIKEAMTLDNFLVMLLTGHNMFSEAFAQASTLYNGAVPKVQMALAQYLNSKYGGAEEMDGVGHKISTQTVSGAGASNVGVAGSVAISLVDGKTLVMILDRESLPADGTDLAVDGNLNVTADTVQKIYTTATVSAHEFGVKKDRLAAATASANASGSSSKYQTTKTDKLTASGQGVGVGASVAFAKAANRVEAIIGENRDVIAGAVNVYANLRNDVETISVAGQDPVARRDSIFGTEEELAPPEVLPGQAPTTQQIVYYGTDPQMIAVDASVAIGMSDNTVIAKVGKNTKLITNGENVIETDEVITNEDKTTECRKVNLYVRAKEHGEGYAKGSGYAAASKAAVGATAAANIANSQILADFGGNGIVKGDALINANAYNEDTAYALATSTGALVDRILQKLGDIQRWLSVGSEGAPGNTISNMLMNQLNGILSPVTTNLSRNPASTTLLTMLSIQVPESAKFPDSVKGTTKNLDTSLQVAAAVGVNITQHEATASVSGNLKAADIDVLANNQANYRTVASGFNVVIFETGASYKISTAVAVSKNKNAANAILGGTAESDSNVDVIAKTTQNMDGTYAGLLTAQALSGGFGGTLLPDGFTLTGAFAGAFAESTTRAEVREDSLIEAAGNVNVIALDWSKQAVRAGSATITANSTFTAGASIAVIDSKNQVYALIGKNTDITANDLTVQALMRNVNEEDYVFPLDTSILFTTGADTEEEDKGIIHLNVEPGKEGFGINLKTEDILALVDAINYFATVNYYAEAISAGISVGGVSIADIAGAVAYVNIENIVKAIIDEAAAIRLTGNLTVDAQADTIARVISGGAAAGVAKVGTGLSVAVLDEKNQITANAGTAAAEANGTISANKVLVNAKNREEVLVINVGMAAVAGTAGLGGSVTYAGNEGVVEAGIGANYTVNAKDNITVTAVNDSDIKVITASPTIAAGATAAVAAGGNTTIINTLKKTTAFVGDRANLTAENDVKVQAETIEKLLNVAASLSATTGVAGAAATTDTAATYTSTIASVGNNVIITSNNGNILILANADSEVLNILAAAAGGRNLAVGAVHMMSVIDRIVAAEVGISSILTALNGNVEIIADSDGVVLVPSAAGAAASTAGINGLISTVLANDEVRATVGAYSIITAEGYVAIVADNEQELYEIGASISAAATASGGGSVVDLFVENNVQAATGDYVSITGYNRKDKRDNKYRGINIQARSKTTIIAGNAGGAASGTVEANGIIQNIIVKNQIIAGAGKHNALNVDVERGSDGAIISGEHAEGSSDQGIVIEADDESELYTISGGIGASLTVGVGIGAQAIVFDSTVKAGIDTGSMSYAKGNIDILAGTDYNVWQVNGTLTAAGKVAVDVAANVIIFESEAAAYAGGELTAANIYIGADTHSKVTQVLISVGGSGAVTVVPMAQVVYFENKTEAYTLDNAVLTAENDVTIEALSEENLNSDSGAVSIAGMVSVGGTVVVAVTKQSTKAYTGKANQITAANIYIKAYDKYDYLIINASISGSAVAVGINASVNVAFNTVSAYVGENSKLKAEEDVEVKAVSERNIEMYGMNVSAAPTAGVGLTVQVAVNGGYVNQDSADEINEYLNADDLNKALAYGRGEEHALHTYLTAREEVLGDALKGDGVKKTETSIGTADKNGDYDFNAQDGYYDQEQMEGIESDTDKLDKNGTPNFTFTPENNADIEGTAGLYDELPDSYKELETNNQKDTVYASIGAGTVVNAGNDILVSADDILTVNLLTGNASAGMAAVGAGMAVIVTNTEVTATVGKDAVLTAGGDIKILANGDYVLSAAAMNGSAGQTITVSGTVAAIDIYSKIEATMKGDVAGAENLYVKAAMENEKLNAQTLSVSASGTATVPVSISMVLMNGELEAGIAGADLSNVTNIYVTTSNHFAPTIETLTAGASMVTLRASIALAINRQKQYTYIDAASSVTGAELVEVTASYKSRLWPEMAGGGAGKAAIGLQAVVAIDSPKILTYIGVNSENTVGTVNKTVEADKAVVGHDVVSEVGTTGTFVNGGMLAADISALVALNRLTAISSIRGINIEAGEVDVYAKMNASAVSEVINGNIGGLAVGATAVVAQLWADNEALIETTNSTLTADKITVSAGTSDEKNSLTAEANGLAAGAGVYTGRINVAIADNKAVNAAKIYGSGMIGATGEVKAQAYATATADANVQSASVSVGNIGAQFALALLRVEQYAMAGNGGTLNAGSLTAISELNNSVSGSSATAQVTNVSANLVGANANVAVAINRSRSDAAAGADNLNVKGAIDVQSKGRARSQATADVLDAGLLTAGAQITYAYAEGIFNSRLYVGNQGQAGSVNVTTTYNTHAKGYTVPTGFGVVTIKGNAAVAKVAGGASATVDGSGTFNVTGAVNVYTSGSAAAAADIPSIQAANVSGITLGVNVAVALVEQQQTSEVKVRNLSANTLTVRALLNGEGEETKATVGSAGGYTKAEISALNGEANVAYARNSSSAKALILGSNVTAKGAIVVRSEGTAKATADRYLAGTIVGFTNVNIIHTHAVTNGNFEAKAAFGSGTSSADSLTVESLFNVISYAAVEPAGTVIEFASIGVNNAFASTTQTSKAGVEAAGTLNIKNNVTVQSKGHARAEAVIRTGEFSLSAVKMVGNTVATYGDAIQNVWFKVTGKANIGGSLNVKAILEKNDGKESGAHTSIAPKANRNVNLSLISGKAHTLTTEARMKATVEVYGGELTTVGKDLTVTTDLKNAARTTGNDAGVNVAFAVIAAQVLDPFVRNELDVIFGGNFKINGNFKVNAVTDSISQVYVKNPTTAAAVSYPTLKVSAQIGTSTNPGRIVITFNEGANIYAKGNIDVLPVNKTYAGITIENSNKYSNVAGIVIDADILTLEVNTKTDIIVGKNAVLKSEDVLTLDIQSTVQAQPTLAMTKSIGIMLSTHLFQYRNVTVSNNTIDIGAGAKLDAWDGLVLHGNTDLYTDLEHSSSNSGFIGSGDFKVDITATRNMIINIGEDAKIQVLAGRFDVTAETGANDQIEINLYGKSAGFIAFGEASTKFTLNDTARVNVAKGANLRINAGNMNLIAKTNVNWFRSYSKWDANGLGANAKVYQNVILNQTAIVRIGERGAAKDAVLRAAYINVHAGVGDLDIYIETEALGDDQIGDVAAKAELLQNLNIQTQAYNAYVEAADNIYYKATGFWKDFNDYKVAMYTKTDIGLGDSDAASSMKIYGEMKVEIAEGYLRKAGATDNWGRWFVGYDPTTNANGDTYYETRVEDYQGGTFVDRYSTNTKNVYKINDTMKIAVDTDIYEAEAPMSPEIILDIYENEDGTVGVNAFGYDVNNGGYGERNIPKVWVEDGILYMEALELVTGGSVEITVINRTSYELSTPGVLMNGEYGEGEYSKAYGGANRFRYFTTNDKNINITHGLGNQLWTFKVVEFYWLGDNAGKVVLTTDVIAEPNEDIDIVINEDGSYTTSREDYMIKETGREELFVVDGSSIVMADAVLSGVEPYYGGIYLTEGTTIQEVAGIEHIHYLGDRIDRRLTLTNNSNYHLVLGRISGITSFDILSNTETDITTDFIFGTEDSTIQWSEGVSGNLYAAADTNIYAGTLIIRGAKEVGTDENPLFIGLYNKDAYLDIESSGSIHITGNTYTEGVGSTPLNELRVKHLRSELIKLHNVQNALVVKYIPICDEENCPDIIADSLSIENSSYRGWELGSSERPLLLDVGEVIFTIADSAVMDHENIYLTAVGDLKVHFNGLYMYDDDDDVIRFYAPNGSIEITNNHISNHLELSARDEITFVNGSYTWFEDSIIEAGGPLTIGGNFIVDGGKDFVWNGSVIIDGDLRFASTQNVKVNDITIGKKVTALNTNPLSIETAGDIVIGSGIGYNNAPLTLTSKEGNVMILGREWLTGVPVIDGTEIYINAADEIIIGEGNGNIYVAGKISADAKTLNVDAGYVSATIINTGDINITADTSSELSLETPETVEIAIGTSLGTLDITADSIVAEDVSMENGTWNITNEVTLNKLTVSGEAALKATQWNVGTLSTTSNMADLVLEASAGSITIGAAADAAGAVTELIAANDIIINSGMKFKGQYTITAGNDLMIDGNVRTEDQTADVTLTAGNDLTVTGTIEKWIGSLAAAAKNITADKLVSQRGDGYVEVTAEEDITVTTGIEFAGSTYIENTDPFVITAGGKVETPKIQIQNGHYVSITAGQIETDNLQVASKADITADTLMKSDYIFVGTESELNLTIKDGVLENGNTEMSSNSMLNLKAESPVGTKENPWKMEFYQRADINLDVKGDIWIKPAGYMMEPHFVLSDRTGHFGIVAGSAMDAEDLYVEKANGDLTLETVGTTPRLHVDVLNGNAVLTVPDMNIDYVDASGNVTIYTENGLDQTHRYTSNEETTIRSAGDITIISQGDIGTNRNSKYALHQVHLVYTGTGEGKVYLEAEKVIYVALEGYENVELGGDVADIYSMTADGSLNVFSNADLKITTMKALDRPNVYIGADNTVALDGLVDVKILLNDDAERIDTAEKLAELLGAEVDSDGTIKLNGNVTFTNKVILDLTEDVVLDLNGYTISQTAESFIFAVENGTLRIVNGSVANQAADHAAIWLGSDAVLTLCNISAAGNAPIRALEGTIILEDQVVLENSDKQGAAIDFAATNRYSGTVLTEIILSPSTEENGMEASFYEYLTEAGGMDVKAMSATDGWTAGTFAGMYYKLTTEEEYGAGTETGGADYTQNNIVILYPESSDEDGRIVYDGNAQTPGVWIVEDSGETIVADESWYTLTYESWNGTSWYTITGAPINVGMYRVTLNITETGYGVKLNPNNILPADGLTFEITQANYTDEEVNAKDKVTVAIAEGKQSTLKELLNDDKSALFELLPEGAVITVDEWEDAIVYDAENGTYTITYTVADNSYNPNKVAAGTIEVDVILGLDESAITITSPDEETVLPTESGEHEASRNILYGMAVNVSSAMETKISYSLDGVNWQETPIKVNKPGEYMIYYKVEAESGYVYTNTYQFFVTKTQILDYANGIFDAELEDVDGNPVEWDYENTDYWYNPGYMYFEGTMAKEGRYVSLKEAEILAQRGWKLEYRLSEEDIWTKYDGEKIFLTNKETELFYRISGDDTFEDALENSINLQLNVPLTIVEIIVSEDGTLRVEGLEPGSVYEYWISGETADGEFFSESFTSDEFVVGKDGKVYLNLSSLSEAGLKEYYIGLSGYKVNPIDEDIAVYYEEFMTPQIYIPGSTTDVIDGSSGTIPDDGDQLSATLEIPELDPESYQGYVVLIYDEESGTWEYLGGVTPDYESMKNGTWNSLAYMETLQDVYDAAGGNGAVTKRLKVVYISQWMFDETVDDDLEAYFNESIERFKDAGYWSDPTSGGENEPHMNLEYMVYLHEKDQPDLRDIQIRIEYPDGSYQVYDDIFDYPIRVYHYDAEYKLAEVIAVDADGNEIEVPEGLYEIVYTRISAAEAAAFALRTGIVLPKEAGYLYRATIVLTQEAMNKYGLTQENLEQATLEFIIGAPDEAAVDDGITTSPIQIVVRENELVSPKASDAFSGLKDNQTVVIESWASGVSFSESGSYEYRYKLYTYYEDSDPIITEGTITLNVEVLSNDVTVNGFGEDTVADPDKSYEMSVTPVDERTGLVVEYSTDGMNWQTETIPVSKPGTYVVYYRVTDYAGNIIESGMDDLVIEAIVPPVETEVAGPNAEPTLSTNYYDGTLGDDNYFRVDMTVFDGNQEDYKLEYSVYIPIIENGVEVGGYWSDYTDEPIDLVKGENRVRIRVTNITEDSEYYAEYIRMYNFTMNEEGYVPEDEIDKGVIVKEFGEDTTADPDTTHQLVVTPNDEKAGLKIEYSTDGENWQSEIIDISKPGTHTVYYRVYDEKGILVQSGSDEIVLTSIKSPVETEVVSPEVEPTEGTDTFEGTLGDDNSFQVDVTVTEGVKEDYKVEYSVFVPTEDGGYWTEYSPDTAELTEGVNQIRVRVTNVSKDADYYDVYYREYKVNMNKKAEEPVEPEKPTKPDKQETQKETEPEKVVVAVAGTPALAVDTSPKTSDRANILGWFVLMFTAAALEWTIRRRKSQYGKK